MEYRVYAVGGARCIRKFESLDDAKAFCFALDTGKSYYIEFRYDDKDAPRRIYI